jgi:RNA polymerase sigma-70 factor (ECF subfamily)
MGMFPWDLRLSERHNIGRANKEQDGMLEQEWLRIYRETVRPLYAYLAKRTGGNRPLVEDIVQETYLRALNSWGLKKKPDAPFSWLKRVGRNILIDHLRRQKWDSSSGLDEIAVSAPDRSSDRIGSLELFSAIASLGRKKSRVLEAFYYEGLSTREISQEMAISERAVEGMLNRARRSLRSMLPDRAASGGKNA